MACLGATTKGGEVNTPECYGYALELFIPWDYMQWLGLDVQAMKDSYVFINPAHITSNNYTGTNTNLDRYWYHYAQQIGTDFPNVSKYFRFNGEGAMGTVEIALEKSEHYSFKGNNVALPGMQVPITVVPNDGYALTSVLVDGKEQIHNATFNKDGSVTVKVRCTGEGHKVSAAAEPITEGKKTLSGKVIANGGMKGLIVSYFGPLGEKPVIIDENGNFQLTDLEPGFYTLKVEKEGYTSVIREVYVNRDMYTELTFKTAIFTVTRGSCWLLDDEHLGILHKLTGAGDIISNESYKDFTLETYVKYDTELAKLSNDDYYLQQRSGVRILFSNGKYWHINLMYENGNFIVQYGKITGDESIFNWKNVHTLTADQIAKYCSEDGIKLTVKRVGNKAAICLDDKVLLIETFAEEYSDYTARLGFESWIDNSKMMDIPFSITDSATLPAAPVIYFYAANTWDVTNQGNGIIYKTGVAGVDTWLDSAIVGNDITTVVTDLTPSANNFSMIYIFKFSNGEQFRVRLNHTDDDGKYRIQSVEKSTVFAAWKNHYTLTSAQEKKVKGDGIAFRVLISGTTAYVYLDGQQVCTYDLSTVVATGQPSGIDKASVNVSLRMDGNIGKKTTIPFTLVQNNESADPVEPDEPDVPVDPDKKITLTIGKLTNGTVTPVKAEYGVGDTVKLVVTPSAGYTPKLFVDGKPLTFDWKTNTYSFVATKKTHKITGSFVKSIMLTPSDVGRWDVSNQAHGIVSTYYPNNDESWWLDAEGEYSAISATVKNYLPVADSQDGNGSTGFFFVLRVTMDNGKFYAFRVINDKGTYAHDHFGAGGSSTAWGTWKALDADAAAALNGDGVVYKLERTGADTLTLSVNGVVMETYVMEGVTADNKVVSMGMRSFGNQGIKIEIPFTLYTSN